MSDQTKGILWLVPCTSRETLPAGRYNPASHLHVTLQFGVHEVDWVSYIGNLADVILETICWDDNIEAIRVSLPADIAAICGNAIPHLTLSHREGIKPFLSNAMLAGEHKSVMLTDRTVGTVHSIPMRIEFHRWG